MRRSSWLLAGVLLCLLAVPVLALQAPENFIAEATWDNVYFTWDAVKGADHYAVDIWATVVLSPDGLSLAVADVELSYATAGRAHGGQVADPCLTVLTYTLLEDIADQLGVPVGLIVTVDGTARVKALTPGKGKDRYSEPAYFYWPPDSGVVD